MTETTKLPDAFADLAPLAARWAFPTENQRSAVRWSSNAADFAAFYKEMMPRIEAILDHLAAYSIKDLPDDSRRLFDLACAFAEASPHHELYGGSPQVPYSFDAKRFVPTHGDKPA